MRWLKLSLTLLCASLTMPPSATVIVANTGTIDGAGGQGVNLLLAAGFVSPSVPTTVTSVDLFLEPVIANSTSWGSVFETRAFAFTVNGEAAEIPEPSAAAFIGLGLFALSLRRYRGSLRNPSSSSE